MKSLEIREKLAMSRADWAKVLNVNLATVVRWETGDHEPAGLAREVIRAISNALLEDGADVPRIGRQLSLGIGALIYYGIMSQLAPVKGKAAR